MSLKYDVPKIQGILKDFHNVTHIDSEIFDKDLHRIVGYGTCGPFCAVLRETECGRRECACSDRLVLERCRENKVPEIHVCHAGLLDIAIPILKEDTAVGYILFGHICNTQSFDQIFSRISWITDDYDRLKTEFSKLIYFDDFQVKSIVNLVTGITTLILSLDLIREESFTLMKQMTAYIEHHLQENLSVEVLCKEFHLSKNALYEHFRDNFQCTVSDYIVKKRMEKAKLLLSDSDLSIAEVAESAGIGDYTYFFKLMKKHTGNTPTQYRKEYRE